MRHALYGLSALSLIFSLLALWTIGGPVQARSERRDAIRLNDLNALNWHLGCLQRAGQGIDGSAPDCPSRPRDHDPFTDEAYRMELLPNGARLLCADFESSPSLPDWMNAHTSSESPGCLQFRHTSDIGSRHETTQ